ncbi:MAG: hypothetical protein ACJAZO_003860 [Myxococcota bacterium]|jgi:hypothetical protein
MPSWNDVRDRLRTTYKLEDDEGELLSIVWTLADNRTQKVVIKHFKLHERDMVEIKSAFAKGVIPDPTELLAKNAEMPLTTVALAGDIYFVVYNAPLKNLHDDDLTFFMTSVATSADSLEKEFGTGDTY